MKATGIVRKIDLLGRIVVPAETRNALNIKIGDPVEIFQDGNNIVLRKYAPGCIFCGIMQDKMISVGDKHVCEDCAKKLKNLVK